MSMLLLPRLRLSFGLLGQLLVILLATGVIEFAANTFFYERSSRTLVRDDEAHRLAEHLVVTRKLISEQSWPERPAMAERLSTDRYDIHWSSGTQPPVAAPEFEPMQKRVVEWEPALADSDLRLRVTSAGALPVLLGALRLPDQTWVNFRAAAPSDGGRVVWQRVLVGLFPAAIILLLGALMFRHMLRPLGILARSVDRIGRGAGLVLSEAGPGEVRRLIRAFNAMQARIHNLITDRTQALAAVGHDLRTPLARLQLRSEAIDDLTLRKNFEADVAEMEAMVGSLLAYLAGETDPETPVRTDVAVLLATVVDDVLDRGGDARYFGPDHFEASVRISGFKRAVGNLVENALHYGHCARVALTVEPDVLVVHVDDDGPGIPESGLSDVVRPFARLDTARARNTSGLGLGLAIVTRVAEQAGGVLRLLNRPEGGLRAELRLPKL